MLNKQNNDYDKQKIIVYVILTFVTLAVYWQVNQYDFVNFDDYGYVKWNNHIQSGISAEGFRWAFETRYLQLWNPLIWISFMIDHQLYGLNAGGYHLTNLILHILSTLLLFWLFCRMTGMVWKSAFVAALFALHPLHVESVAWISERKDVLSTFFWMLTLCLYVYYTEKPVIKRYLLVVFSFIMALMSKPMVVTLPVILILLDFWPLNRFQQKKDDVILWQLKEKLPFFILSAILVAITLYHPGTDSSARVFPLASRLANAPVAFVTYLIKTFWPYDLAVFYPFSDKLPLWQVSGTTVLILLISAAVMVMLKRFPYLFFGWMWYAITIAPVIGIIQISKSTPYSMADRYHYLTSIGISVGLVWGISSLIRSENLRKNILFPSGVIFIVILTILTWRQCNYWRDSIELWIHALKVTENNYVAHNNLGYAFSGKGKIGQAVYHYDESIRIKNDYYIAYNNRASAYSKLNNYEQAIEDLTKSLSLKPDFAESYYNRGTIYAQLNQYQRALNDLNETLRLNPEHTLAYLNRAVVYLNQGNRELGCADARKACQLGNCRILKTARENGDCR